MKRIAQTFFITMTIIMIYSMSAFAAVDYNVMTNEELDVIIEDNNSIIDTKSVKLTEINNKCIELIKKNTKPTEEFKIKINEYTENLKIYTERIRAQKEVCQKKSLKMENAKLNNKKKSYIKKQQIKYIKSQNKLSSILRKATKESNEMKKYIRSSQKVTESKVITTTDRRLNCDNRKIQIASLELESVVSEN
ncbi:MULTISPECIES: hypothetical protein [unclassified Eubacterium (in: firmicutes)]|jgi:hypothetical protein|uniref:hypothetical protein n=1 Tax=Eubacterium TaxID=1730 RepID=UPI00033E5862|nr:MULTISPECIES: hypothetical protein [unclassified Eubacterium (in: firmicutes)]MCJ7967408.1 hypothetical protein [Lachnospiraceae bacterium NSJ-171]RGG67322.1 hypothetical protein DWW96_01270 [Eubacterium sp. AF17-7]CDA28639.1 unknown [Eubacterium sp. CAG:156]